MLKNRNVELEREREKEREREMGERESSPIECLLDI